MHDPPLVQVPQRLAHLEAAGGRYRAPNSSPTVTSPEGEQFGQAGLNLRLCFLVGLDQAAQMSRQWIRARDPRRYWHCCPQQYWAE